LRAGVRVYAARAIPPIDAEIAEKGHLWTETSQNRTMPDEEKRKYPRVTTHNVVSYICLDADGRQIAEGMGTTVDISQGGTLLETSRPIETEYILLLSIDLDDNVVETKGKVAHSRSVGPGKYLTGIQFLGEREEVTRVVKNFIIDYHSRKNTNG
jgi:c-di-GMP-binding flagellar brake protein YcgR